MAKYNIIYKSPGDESYLWNGSSLDRVENKGPRGLMFSGKTFTANELTDAVKKCKEAVRKLFKNQDDTGFNAIKVKVADA